MLAGATVCFSAYVALQVAPEILGARQVLSGPVDHLSTHELERARDHLAAANDSLESGPADVLRLLPIARQNIDALARVTDSLVGVVDAGSSLKSVSELGSTPLLVNGTIDLALLTKLQAPLDRQAGALTDLELSLRKGRNGWLLPPLWGYFDSALDRVAPLATGARSSSEALSLAQGMLGSDGKRTYLVVLLNNAELRGAGGLPSGAGILTTEHGHLRLGDFYTAAFMRGDVPYVKVPSSPDFEQRFGRYGADTTLWVNSTMSPDVADVAQVTSEIARLRTGERFDGVMFVDPIGLAALVDGDAQLSTEGGMTLPAKELPAYVMSDAYAELGGLSPERESSLVELGQAAFGIAVDEGFSSVEDLSQLGGALGGGHLRVVSLHADEARSLEKLGVTGRPPAPSPDGLLVTAQNTGADKLDYWTRRTIDHRCTVTSTEAWCSTEVSLVNRAPDGLSPYVAGRPYGVLHNFLEVYVPRRADIREATVDGKAAEVLQEHDGAYASVGTSIELPRGERTTFMVDYRLPLDGSYSLAVTPQPLATDARLTVALVAPNGWVVGGPDRSTLGDLDFRGPLDSTLTFTAAPEGRPGLSGAWARLSRWWSEPVGS